MEKKLSLEELNNVAQIDVVYKKKIKCKVSVRPQINSSREGYEILLYHWNEDKLELLEEFKVLYLNRPFKVLQLVSLSKGGITEAIIDTRLILAGALNVATGAILLCHNHLLGSLTPSRANEELIQKIKNAGLLDDTRLRDHIIITSEGYYSFSEEELP